MDFQTGITIVAVLLGGAGLGGAWRASRTVIRQGREVIETVGAMNKVADAQLTENGGGSLVDKVNKTWEAVPIIQKTVVNNHAEAKTRWTSLDRLEADVKELKDGRDAGLAEMARIAADVAEFKRGQAFFARFGPALLQLETEERRKAIAELAERIAADLDQGKASP